MPTSRISHRVAAIAESATLAVDAKAKALKAAGETVIGFGAGEPDFPTPDHIVEAAIAACPDPKNHRYTPGGRPPGAEGGDRGQDARATPATRSRANQVLVTNGGKHAIYDAFAALLDPGDEVLLPAPYWTTYPEPMRLAGGVVVELPTDGSRRLQGHRRAARGGLHRRAPRSWCSCRRRTRRASSTRRAEVEAIGQWAVEHGIWVLTDEIYEHLTYGDARPSRPSPRSCPSWPTGWSSSTGSPRPTP